MDENRRTHEYEPPVLPPEQRDPNSDTRIPPRDRVVIGDVADIAFRAQAGYNVEVVIPNWLEAWVGSYMAAAEAAYAAGFDAGYRAGETNNTAGGLTQADADAYDNPDLWCGAPEPDLETTGLTCNRAKGHAGQHAQTTDDDRAGSDLSPLGIVPAWFWPQDED